MSIDNMTEQIKQAMDLDNWTETIGTGSVDSVVCPHPHCGARFAPAVVEGTGPGLYCCGTCKRPFLAMQANTPLGKAWLTEATSEEKLNAQALARSRAAADNHCTFAVISVERDAVKIVDLNRGRSVTNDAAYVVAQLQAARLLPPGRKLYYFDSAGDLDEIVWDGGGEITFRPGPGRLPS